MALMKQQELILDLADNNNFFQNYLHKNLLDLMDHLVQRDYLTSLQLDKNMKPNRYQQVFQR